MAKRKINGYGVVFDKGWYDPDDGSFGDQRGMNRPNAREAWSASIDNGFMHLKTLFPFDSEKDAEKAARNFTAEQKAESNARTHAIFRRY